MEELLIRSILLRAIRIGDLQQVRIILNIRPPYDPQNELNQALMSASAYGRLDIVRELLDRGADIHTHSEQSLLEAIWNGHLNVVRELIDRGADIHVQNDKPLLYASDNDQVVIVRELLIRGADISRLRQEKQQIYQRWVPVIISIQEYYNLELLAEDLQIYPQRYVLLTEKGTYSLFR
jgi:ankyrin repeat protein